MGKEVERHETQTGNTDDKNIIEAAKSGDRLETLIALRDLIADRLQNTTSSRDISSMSRRLMQCVQEIEILERQREGMKDNSLKVMREQLKALNRITREKRITPIENEKDGY